jgi:uncharacterized protein
MGKAKSVLYKDRKGEWRFRLVAGNGKILAVSSEGYSSKRNALYALDLVDYFCWTQVLE